MKFLFFIFISFFLINNENLNLKVLNSNLVSGDSVDLMIKNNSDYTYCFVIDTNFYSRNTFINNDIFQNPTIVLYNKLGVKIKKNIQLKSSRYKLDSINVKNNFNDFLLNKGDTLFVDEFKMYSNLYKKGFVNTLAVFNIAPKQSIKIKVPFNLVTQYKKDNIKEYYDINRMDDYKARIEYFITRDFVEKSISKARIDSIESRGIKIFTGKLVSNKISLILK